MNIDDNATRLFSTIIIWIATAVIFVFGFFRMNVTGVGLLPWFAIGMALAIGPAVATKEIWKSQPSRGSGAAKPDDSGNSRA
jgi:hypothetical protein